MKRNQAYPLRMCCSGEGKTDHCLRGQPRTEAREAEGGLESQGLQCEYRVKYTCASRTTGPWFCDLKQAGQRRALKPHTADLASLQAGDAGSGLP